jgi:hypothetical protein
MTGNVDFELHPKTLIITFVHRFNGRGYRTYWQEYGVNFMILYLGVLC